ncbi:hypothetical protein E2C01_028589 [Portunus trituberculatus]|uniref:Uncharacterized protein n=1 Tax=Portunus trituberculatus TaxID=210409 RepID=A0A5B7EL24_PORTR|nr:hypothetical protein [Portunus trituberculatus]
MSAVVVQFGLIREEMQATVGEARQFTLEHDWRLQQDLARNTGVAKTVIGEEVVAAQDLPVSDRQLCGMTGHCTKLRGPVMTMIMEGGVEEKLPVFMADMEKPCLLGLDFLVQSAACVGLGRIQMQVRGETVPLILEDAVEQDVRAQ